MRMSARSLPAGLILISLLLQVVMAGCSPKKNTAVNRGYQGFITKYNILYNGWEHYDRTVGEMEENYEDDYLNRLYVHPSMARRDEGAPQPSGSFERSKEKAIKAIQLRSLKKRPRRTPGRASRDPEYAAWLRRDEYNPEIHKAWMLLGKSRLMNGEPEDAAATFGYVVRHFTWLPATVAEAKVWGARANALAGNWYQSEKLIGSVSPDSPGFGDYSEDYYLTLTDILLSTGREKEAVPALREALRYARGRQKLRLRFLLAQLLQQQGAAQRAYDEYGSIARSHTADYRTRLNARVRQTEVYPSADIRKEVNSLRSMLRFGKNSRYADQLYYAIGNLYLSRGDTVDAIENYKLAINRSERKALEMALARLRLGEVYYALGDYDKAQPQYAAALPLLRSNHPGLDELRRRSNLLDELAAYAQSVALHDSLLHLASLPAKRQLAEARKRVDELRAAEKEAQRAARVEGGGDQPQPLASGAMAPVEFAVNTDKSWYFYNAHARNAGRIEFQRTWGNRKLEDDWRRRNKTSFSFSDEDTAETELSDNKSDADTMSSSGAGFVADDPHTPEYYLRQIPRTEAERKMAHRAIQDGLYNMGIVLKNKFEDHAAARRQLLRLLNEYPDNIYRLDAYHNLLLMAMQDGDTQQAEKYRLLIVSEFADSPLGVAMADPSYMANLGEMGRIQNSLYEKAYGAFLAGERDTVHAVVADVERRFSTSPLMPGFLFLDAAASAAERDSVAFGFRLEQIRQRYPEADVAPLAADWAEGLRQGRKLQSSGVPVRSNVGRYEPQGADTVMVAETDSTLMFSAAEDGPRMLALIWRAGEVNGNQLLYEVARFNFSSFTIRDFDLEQVRLGEYDALLIKGFLSRKDLSAYRRRLPALPAEVEPLAINESDLMLIQSGRRTVNEYRQFLEGQSDMLQQQLLETTE